MENKDTGHRIGFDTQFPTGWQQLIAERDEGKGPLYYLEEKYRKQRADQNAE